MLHLKTIRTVPPPQQRNNDFQVNLALGAQLFSKPFINEPNKVPRTIDLVR